MKISDQVYCDFIKAREELRDAKKNLKDKEKDVELKKQKVREHAKSFIENPSGDKAQFRVVDGWLFLLKPNNYSFKLEIHPPDNWREDE